jgi:hypothetical protein
MFLDLASGLLPKRIQIKILSAFIRGSCGGACGGVRVFFFAIYLIRTVTRFTQNT